MESLSLSLALSLSLPLPPSPSFRAGIYILPTQLYSHACTLTEAVFERGDERLNAGQVVVHQRPAESESVKDVC